MNTYTPTQLKDALRILKAFRDRYNHCKPIRTALDVAIAAVEKEVRSSA